MLIGQIICLPHQAGTLMGGQGTGQDGQGPSRAHPWAALCLFQKVLAQAGESRIMLCWGRTRSQAPPAQLTPWTPGPAARLGEAGALAGGAPPQPCPRLAPPGVHLLPNPRHTMGGARGSEYGAPQGPRAPDARKQSPWGTTER